MKTLLFLVLNLVSLTLLANSGEKEIRPPVIQMRGSTVDMNYGNVGYHDDNGGQRYSEYYTAVAAFELQDGSLKLIGPYRHTAVGEAYLSWNQRKEICSIFNFNITISKKKGAIVTKKFKRHKKYESITIKEIKRSIVAEIVCQ